MSRDIAADYAAGTESAWDALMKREAEAEAEWERTHQHLLLPSPRHPLVVTAGGWDPGAA